MKSKLLTIILFCFIGIVSAQHNHNHEGQNANETDSVHATSAGTEETKGHEESNVGHEAVEAGEPVKASLDSFPNLHPLVVHFPIVLLLLAGLLQLIQLFVLNRNLDWVILLCVGVGFIGAYIAGVYAHPHTHNLTEAAKQVLEQHDKFAEWTIYASALGAVLKLGSLFLIRKKRLFEIAVFLILGFAAFSVSEAGHYGAQLVYLEGVGPQGEYLETEADSHTH
ncbi:hypothetical protein E0K83_16705 [Gramella sp. BOM4]|nr:hypothetical protein [Christiangramia bathymodioli]